jgi:signal recognition particle receptor subunit beta
MVQINFGQREVNCKVVYYGPAMAGKTTNIEWIHQHSPQTTVGDLVSIKTTETDRTLYFDFLPLDLGLVGGMRTRFKLYTVPGQVYYNATRKLVLQGADGVVFVADSRPERMNDNVEALLNLRMNLDELGITMEKLPLVLQYNLRDLPNAMTIRDMDARLNPTGVLPVYSGIARDGTGVFSCLKEVSRGVIDKLNKHPMDGGANEGGGAPAPGGTTRPFPTPAQVSRAAPAPGAPPPAARFPRSAATPAGAMPQVPAAGIAVAERPTEARASSSTAMPVMRPSALPPRGPTPARRGAIPPPPADPLRPSTPARAPARPSGLKPAPPEGPPILTLVTGLALVIVLVCIVVGAYAMIAVGSGVPH